MPVGEHGSAAPASQGHGVDTPRAAATVRPVSPKAAAAAGLAGAEAAPPQAKGAQGAKKVATPAETAGSRPAAGSVEPAASGQPAAPATPSRAVGTDVVTGGKEAEMEKAVEAEVGKRLVAPLRASIEGLVKQLHAAREAKTHAHAPASSAQGTGESTANVYKTAFETVRAACLRLCVCMDASAYGARIDRPKVWVYWRFRACTRCC